ncbi:hypothetical protein H0E87_000278 [Populus deltoides]|jgi:hypothetical protein|uniref:Uncharacterized protein n=1 Tax=Populus deltoides TaxID=3696 RepID=A0A8T2ZM05_POPDE|nr:hypothetical protein H0E87_000278 [Populus deltoides]
MADPYTLGHITDANFAAGTSTKPQIEKMVEQIRLLSEEVVRLRVQLTVHPQPHHNILAHNLPLQPQRTLIARRRLSYVKGYGHNKEEPLRRRSRSPTREHSYCPTIPVRSEHSN